MALSLPDLIFEVSYGTGAWEAPSWVDETAYLRAFKCKRGRQHELVQSDTGTSKLILLNNDRRFDPTYLAGPHGGELLPGVRFRLRAVWAGVTYPILHNWAERWFPRWPRPAASDTELTGVGAFKAMHKKKITTTGYAETVLADGPSAYYRLNESQGPAANDSSGNGQVGTYLGTPSYGVPGLILTDDDTAIDTNGVTGWMALPNSAAITGTGPLSVEVWFKTGNVDATYRTLFEQDQAGYQEINIATWNGKLDAFGPGTASFDLAGAPPVNDNQRHHAVLTRNADGRTWKIYLDGFLWDTQDDGAVFNLLGPNVRLGGAYVVGSPLHDGPLDELALYHTELSHAQIIAHYNLGIELWAGQHSGERIDHVLDVIGWPSADRDIDTGSSLVQPVVKSLSGSGALDYMQLIEKSEAGLFYEKADEKVGFRARGTLFVPPYTVSQATFGDGPGELPYQPAPEVWQGDDDIYSEGIGQRIGGNKKRAFDQASNDKFGPSTYDLGTDLWLTTDGEVEDRLQILVSRYKDSAPRIGTLRVRPLNDPANIFPVVLALEEGYRVTVKRRPPGGGAAFSQAGIIESISHEKTEEGDWIVEYEIGAADFADYWILGTSTLDVDTRLAY